MQVKKEETQKNNLSQQITTSYRNLILFSIILLSLLLHFKHFSKDLISVHVWRQTQTQITINNFYEEDMNIFNPRKNDRGDTEGLFRMEFPLMQWTVAALYQVFGQHLIISRIFMFLIGILSTIGIYFLLMELFGKQLMALFGAWAFTFSPSFFYYTINPLPDNLSLCCAIWGMALFFTWAKNPKTKWLLLSSFLLAISALCKLPFMIYFIIPLVYFIRQAIQQGIKVKLVSQVLLVFVCSLMPLAWYAWVIPQWDENMVLSGVFDENHSNSVLIDYYIHNVVSALPEMLLNYGSVLLFIAGFYFLVKRKAYQDSRFVLILSLSIMALVYYFFEANAINKIHDYYLFPFMPLLFILVAYGGYYTYQSKKKFLRYGTLFLAVSIPVFCYLRMIDRWNYERPGFNEDLLIYQEDLKNAVDDNDLVVLGNDDSHHIYFYYLNKKGWAFNEDRLSSEKLKSMIEKGAKYIYIDSDTLVENPEINQYFDDLVLQRGSFRVYALK